MKKVLVIISSIIILSSCTRIDKSTEVLEDAGYHPIEVGGYSLFGCSEDDTFQTKFKAYNADSSKIVTGVVCGGIIKGNTIRLD